MAWSVLGSRHADGLAGPNIELRAVPWANQTSAIELAISEGPAVVGAHIFDAVDDLIDLDENNESIVDFEGLGLVGPNLVPWTNVMKRRHGRWLFHSYCRTWRAIAAPRASRTVWMVMRSKICWKNPVTIIRIASDLVNPRD